MGFWKRLFGIWLGSGNPDDLSRRCQRNEAVAHVQRGAVYLMEGECDKAIVQFNKAIRIYGNRVIAYAQMGEWDKAIADIYEVIRLCPGSALAYFQRGGVYLDKRDWDKAVADFDEAIRLNLNTGFPALLYEIVERYPSGAVKARGPHYHGDRQEHWTFYYESGEKECEGEYVQGFESDEWSFWHRNGQLRARGRLDDGSFKTGEWTYFDEAGQPLSEAEFLALYPSDSLHRWPPRRADQAVEPGPASDPARDIGSGSS